MSRRNGKVKYVPENLNQDSNFKHHIFNGKSTELEIFTDFRFLKVLQEDANSNPKASLTDHVIQTN